MIYNAIIFLGFLLARAYSVFDDKMKRFFDLRKCETKRIKIFFESHKNKKAIWFHASSAGEFEQCKPLIEKLKDKKDYLIIASFFSPSGYDAGIKYKDIDFCFNLPLDYRKNATVLPDIIKPEMLIYSKYDVWRNLTCECAARSVKLALISATLPEKSKRHKYPAKLFFKKPYSLLDKIYAISQDDADRFAKITGKPGNIVVAGDTRFDRVKDVIERRAKKDKIIKREKGKIYFVAGSTYRHSETKLLWAIKKCGADLRTVLVPHEVDEKNITRLVNLVRENGFVPLRATVVAAQNSPVAINENEILIVDRFGMLAYLYEEADIVFIGGSFKGSVHSVLEPAIFGKPIISGPHIGNAYEALMLAKTGGLAVCNNEAELYEAISKLAGDTKYRALVSKNVKGYFNENLGAVKIIAADML